MKKFLCVFLVLLVLMSATLPVAAAEKTWQDIIFEEVVKLVDIEKYAANDKDKNVYLLSLIETGYGEKGFEDGNALYLYLYNPSRKEISQSDLNQIQMAIGWDDAKEKPVKFKKYPIKLEGSTMNGLYLRCKVDKVTAKELALVKDGTRKYGITEIELVDHGEFMGEAYEVGYSFEFSGYGEDLKCNRESFLTLELEVGHTSRVIGSSDTEGYYNQVVSVYFSIPEEIEKEYGLLYDIDYEYAKYRTVPMILSTDDDFIEAMTPLLGEVCSITDWPVSLYMQCTNGTGIISNYYFYGDSEDSGWLAIDELSGNYVSEYRILLKASTLVPGKTAVSSEQVEKYFKEYTDANPPKYASLIYGYSPNLFENPFTSGHEMKQYHFTRDDLFEVSNNVDKTNWLGKLFGFSKIVHEDLDISYIQRVDLDLSALNFSSEEFCEQYYIGDSDFEDFKKFKTTSNLKDESVYLLRFAYSDQFAYDSNCVPYRSDVTTAFNNAVYENEDGDLVFGSDIAIVQEDVYLGFDILRLGFSDDGEDITTFGVVMSPVNIFPSVDNPSDPTINNDPKVDWLRLIVAALALLVLIIAIFRLPGLFASISQTSANRQMRKYYRNQNRYNRR